MRKGPLNFLGRKNQSLFDTNIKFKDMDNVELVLESSAIPESGTASVRARPTVKHHSPSSFESFQGFNVPTPKVPLLPPANGPKINGSVGEDRLSNGSVVSVPDVEEGDIFVPPPPSMAPPPPPFIPPPDFMGDLNSLDLATLQPPPMPAPKPTSLAPSMGEENFTFLKPPPIAPPKPPSTCSSGSASSVPISSPPPAIIPQHPKFAPPQPPSERQHKTFKTPPPKPIRLSSISNLDSPPQTPAPPPPVQTPTLSTFNPQNTAKLYNTPQTSILSGYEDHDTRPKKMLVLEDSGSVKPAPLLPQVDGKAPKVTTPSKPVSKDVQELKENLNITQPSPSPPPEPNKVAKTGAVSVPPEIDKHLQTVHQMSPQLKKVNGTLVNSEPSKDKLEVTPSPSGKFSPLLDRKLRNLKSSETSGARDGPVASPLALLMAAKERDKHRSNQSLSRENSGKKNEQPSASIHPSDSNPNSFIVTPRSSSSSSLTSQDTIQESPKSARPVEHTQTTQTQQKSSSPALVRDPKPFASPVLNRMAKSKSVTSLIEQKQNEEQSRSKSQSSQLEENTGGLNMPLLPPPPEFGDFDEIVGPPPSMLPPDPPMKKPPTPGLPVGPPPSMVPPGPPMKKAPTPGPSPPPPPSIPPPDPPMKKAPTPGHFAGPHPSMPPPDPPMKKASTPGHFAGPHPPMPPPDPPMKKASTPAVSLPPPAPSPPPPPKPPAAPKLPLPDTDIKPKPQVQTKPKVASPQLPANLSPSQATLLSILQKKMLEMDHKMAPVKEAESSSDDWGTPLSDDDNKVPVVPKATPQNKNSPVVNKAPALDMRELEGKVARKYQETSSLRFPTSNGPSKHKYGMTFTVRPGTRNPITPYSKEDS